MHVNSTQANLARKQPQAKPNRSVMQAIKHPSSQLTELLSSELLDLN
jgi:hypothetical protein